MNIRIPLLAALLAFSSVAYGAFSAYMASSGTIIPAANNYAWTPGLTYGLAGGIPVRNTVCATLSPIGLITTVTASISGSTFTITSGATSGIAAKMTVYDNSGTLTFQHVLGVITGGSGNSWTLDPAIATGSSTMKVYAEDVAQINSAISSCPAGQVLALSAGTFNIVGPDFILLNSGITLRGAGAGTPGAPWNDCPSTCTILLKTNGSTIATVGVTGAVGPQPGSIMIVGPTQFSSGTDPADPTGNNIQAVNAATNLTADAVAGTNTLHVTSATGFTVGKYIILDQASPSTWQPDTLIGNNPLAETSTITMTCATPTVVSWATHNIAYGTPIQFSGGTLCTGISAGTNYYVTNDATFTAGCDAFFNNCTNGSFHISDTQAHAIAGTNTINGTGSSSGTITGATQNTYQVWVEGTSNYPLKWAKGNPSVTFIGDFNSYQYPTLPVSNGDTYGRLNRPRNELCKITVAAGTTLTCEKPFTYTYLVANTAQVATMTPTFVEQAGVEQLTVSNGDGDSIEWKWCAYCWGKNLKQQYWAGQGLDFFDCYYCELRASYSTTAANASPGGGAYAIALDASSTGILIENNISILSNKVIVARAGGAGSVVGYNYFDDPYINYQETWIEIGCNASHFVGPHHVLFEANYCPDIDSDDTHGTSNYLSFFRNWTRGLRSTFVNPYTGNTVNDSITSTNGPFRAYGPQSYSTFHAMVCNVAGASGAMSGWTFNQTNWQAAAQNIWMMGWDSTVGGVGSYTPDVPNTIWRAGNWDWLNSQQTWQNGTVGQTFPTSLYQGSKPAFMGASAWPWVDCTNGSTGTLSAGSNLPAIARYYNGTPNVTPNDHHIELTEPANDNDPAQDIARALNAA